MSHHSLQTWLQFFFAWNQYSTQHDPLTLSLSINWLCFWRHLVFMGYKQDVIIQSQSPWMSVRLFSLRQELMGAEISEPQPQTGRIHQRASAWDKRKVDEAPGEMKMRDKMRNCRNRGPWDDVVSVHVCVSLWGERERWMVWVFVIGCNGFSSS